MEATNDAAAAAATVLGLSPAVYRETVRLQWSPWCERLEASLLRQGQQVELLQMENKQNATDLEKYLHSLSEAVAGRDKAQAKADAEARQRVEQVAALGIAKETFLRQKKGIDARAHRARTGGCQVSSSGPRQGHRPANAGVWRTRAHDGRA